MILPAEQNISRRLEKTEVYEDLRICQTGIFFLSVGERSVSYLFRKMCYGNPLLYYHWRKLAGHFFGSFWQRMEVLKHQFGFVSFLSMVLSQGATDIQEGVLVALSRIHPVGRHRQRKWQQSFLQYGDGEQDKLMVVVVVVVQASLVDGMAGFHNCRDVGAIHCY